MVGVEGSGGGGGEWGWWVRKFLSFFGAHGHWGGGGVALFLSTDIHTQDRLIINQQ